MRRILAAALVAVLAGGLALGYWLGATEAGLRWLFPRLVRMAPGTVTVEELHGRLIGPVLIRGLQVRLDGAAVHAEELSLDWRPAALLGATLSVSRLHLKQLRVVLPASSQRTGGPLTLPQVRLPVTVSLHDVLIEGVQAWRGGEELLRLSRVTLKGTAGPEELAIARLEIEAPAFRTALRGHLQPAGRYPLDLEADWRLALPDTPPIEARSRVHGDLKRLRVDQSITAPVKARLTGEIRDVLKDPRWQASAEVSPFDPHALNPRWPAGQTGIRIEGKGDQRSARVRFDGRQDLVGTVRGKFLVQRTADGAVRLSDGAFSLPDNGARLGAEGTWRPGEGLGRAELGVTWQNLPWPLEGAPRVVAPAGGAYLEGTPADYRFRLSTGIGGPGLPPSYWAAVGGGSQTKADLGGLWIATLDGRISGNARLEWSPEPAWQATLEGRDLDPARQWPGWPGRLGFRLKSSGRYSGRGLEAAVTLPGLDGSLRGHPVSLQAAARLRDTALTLDRFELRSEDSLLSVHGRVGDTVDLGWRFRAPDLGKLYPAAGGNLKSEGSVRGPRATPEVAATFSGDGLMLEDYRIKSLEATLAVDLFRWQALGVNLKATGLQAGGWRIDDLRVQGRGKRGAHRLTLAVTSPWVTVNAGMEGHYSDGAWTGRLSRADVLSPRLGRWTLRQPAPLAWARDSAGLGPLCWAQETGTLCLEGQQRNGRWEGRANARQFPLAVLSPWLPPDLQLQGAADLDGTGAYQSGVPLQAELSIHSADGGLSYPLPGGERGRWGYRETRLQARLDAGGLRAQWQVTAQDGDRLQARAQLPGVDLLHLEPATQVIHASVDAAISDLTPVELLILEIQDLKGALTLGARVDGTLAEPRVSGQATLTDGRFQIPRLGLSIEALGLNVHSDDARRLRYALSARSGDGTLQVAGETTLDGTAGWPTQLTAKGKDFEIARIPEARVEVSPDLKLSLQHREIHVDGEIRVPLAKLQPKTIGGAATVSRDVVVVGAPEPEPEKWRIYTKVKITLGERVTFDGFGFEGRLGGSALLTDEPDRVTVATGELTVLEGRYQAYGQRLQVERGRVLFAGGPVTNPGLDIRAIRQVGDVTAGINILGTLRAPRVELFSIPAMGQSEALAYLILGQPLQGATGEDGAMMTQAALALGFAGSDLVARSLGERFGLDEMRVETTATGTGEQASLIVGRYLSPRLYVSYGVGLIDAVNTVRLRYRLTNRWQVEVEAGAGQGADMVYTIER